MVAPEGYSALGKIGISYKGEYASSTAYERLDAVAHNGSTYLAIKDAPDGAPRDDKVNWIYLAKGFSGDIGDSEIAFTEAENRENINTGESVKTVFGKIKKFFADLTAPAFAQMITSKDDLLATKATGYVPDAKAVADGFADVNGNLTYSTEETICGKWIDGRKIYRVVKQVTSNINTNIVALSLPTASRVIDIKGTIETNENRTIPIYCTWETGLSIYAYYYQSEKNIYLNNKVGSGTAYIIVEYIK